MGLTNLQGWDLSRWTQYIDTMQTVVSARLRANVPQLNAEYAELLTLITQTRIAECRTGRADALGQVVV